MNRREFLTGSMATAGGALVGAGCANVPPAAPPKSAKIPYRMFWNWDHSTNWCEDVLGVQNVGVANPYTKVGDFFEQDFRRMVDWCAAHGMQAIGIVGLLRDWHGGVETARRLCGYARDKGVRIYIIAGLYAYGGAYYEGDSKYNLDAFFRANPDCIARKKDGSPFYARFKGHGGPKVEAQGCPSNPNLNAYVLESYDWLFKTIPELGGIQMEAGDNGVCQCPKCKERRGRKAAQEHMSLEDMAGIYPQLVQVVRARDRESLVICETYHHFLDQACGIFYAQQPDAAARALFDMPKDVFWQWKCDRMLDADTWTEGARLPPAMQGFHHVMRSHAATQWWGGRGSFDVDKIRRQCRLSHLSGLDAVSMFGEVSPFHANAELNYLALQYFADHPLASNANFVWEVMAPLLGGAERAEQWWRWARLENAAEKIPEATASIARIAADATDREVRRRWTWLGARLESFYWEWERNGHKSPNYSRNANVAAARQRREGTADHL